MPSTAEDVARLKWLEHRLDHQFRLFGISVGFDGIVGLVPVLGDVVTGALGLYIILEARRLGARRSTLARMLVNWVFDFGIGAVPVFGDLFDIAFKSNSKNLRLLLRDLERNA